MTLMNRRTVLAAALVLLTAQAGAAGSPPLKASEVATLVAGTNGTMARTLWPRPLLSGLYDLLPAPDTEEWLAPFVAAHPPAQLVMRRHGTAFSTNWAGYAASGTTFADVKGRWVVPEVICSKGQPQLSSFWLGIDGFTSGTVEQIGTDADCVRGKPLYFAWFEMFPAKLVVIPLDVAPGEAVAAEVSASGNTFKLDITVGMQPTFSVTQSSTAAERSSAEWIAEGPSPSLADFGAV